MRDGNRWGYITRNGKEEKMYDGAGDFVQGRAIVLDNGTAYVINENLSKISDGLTGYTAVETVGKNLFGVQKDGKWYLAVYSE